MDPQRIRRAALGKRATAELAQARRRLIVYSVGLVLVGVWYGFGRRDTQAPAPATEPMEFLEGPVQSEPLARVDRALLQGVRDGTRTERASLEPEAAAHLLDQARKLIYGDLAKLGLTAVPRRELVEHAARHRGDAVWVIGSLDWFERVPGSSPATYRGELRGEHGDAWTFLVAVEPWDVHPGDVVRAQGFFLKHYDMLRPDRSFASGPLVVGEELLASAFRIGPVVELREDLFDAVVDRGMDEASRPLDSLAFYELLSYVQNADEAELFAQGAPEEVRPQDLLAAAPQWRGQPVKIFGQVLYKQRIPLGPRGENPLGIPFAWQLWVQYYGETALVVMLDEPAGLENEHIAEVDGLFFRRYAYENRRNEPRMAAVVLAKRVQRFVPAPSELTPVIVRIILVLVAACGILLGFGAWRDRRSSALARTQRVRRARKLFGLAQPPGPSGGEDGGPEA